jgi:general secretion pathway protein D
VPGAPGMWVVHLKNADATKLAPVLRAAFAGALAEGSGGGGGGSSASLSPSISTPTQLPSGRRARRWQRTASAQSTAPVTSSGQPQTGGYIQADPSTNSLIITAPEPLYRQLRAMIDQLDQRRAQVYIESMIVEVAGGDATDFGFDWLGLLGQSNDKTGAGGAEPDRRRQRQARHHQRQRRPQAPAPHRASAWAPA